MKLKLLLLFFVSLFHCLHGQEVATGAFTGAGPDEGLDLTTEDGGEFLYAVNIGGGAIQVGDRLFTADDDTPGVEWDALNVIPAWGGINDFGPGADDAALAEVMHSIRWSNAPSSVTVTLEGITPGVEHRLQLLFAEKCCQRGWDITVDGELLADDYSARALSNDADLTQAAFLRYDFIPDNTSIVIDLNGQDADFEDRNPILSAVTLEKLDTSDDDPNFAAGNRLRFGQVASTPASTETLTLRNLGTANTLTISDVRITGDQQANFTLGGLPASIAPGETAPLEVTFDAMGESGLFEAVIEIDSDDPSDPVSTVTVSASVINRNGPAGRYAFDEATADEALRDSSGNDRDGAYVSTVNPAVPGQTALVDGTATQFSAGAFANIPGNAFEAPLDSFAFAMWIQPGSLPNGLQTLAGKGELETPSFAILTEGTSVAWFTGGEAPELVSDPVLTVGQTHHVAAIYDNTLGARKVALFVDGVMVAELADPVTVEDLTSYNIVLGAYNGALPFDGVIDDLQIYDRLITASDVAFLHANPGSGLGEGGAVDSDGDGLLDSAETEAMTDPLNPDTDGDRLSDGAEVNTHGTSPILRDTDGDGFDDEVEVRKGSDPLSGESQPDAALQISLFTGGDPGEGLDMEGSFVYAVNFRGPGGGRLGDAIFTDDEIDGIQIDATNEALNWHNPNYGDSQADDALEVILQSIRWSTGAVTINVNGLQIGQRYSMQLLFAEACCARGFDVVIDGELEADEFSPDLLQERSASVGVVGTYFFTAEKETLSIALTNEEANFPDINPIIQGLTLEALGIEGDSDADGLLDAWENLVFGNLSETAEGDPDSDGLSNLRELDLSTTPTDSDSDDDGLLDGAEVDEHMTDPLLVDTDGDGLTDSAEVNTLPTDATLADTDDDGQSDGFELAFGGDALDPNAQATGNAEASAFMGGDAGEGLDLDGDFVYAINMLGEGDLPVRDALFTTDDIEGFVYDQPNELLAWHLPDYGETTNDDNLERVIESIRWNAGPSTMRLQGLTPGHRYKLQMLFAENCCDRGWDIYLQSGLVFDDFNIQLVQGGIAEPTMGVVVTSELISPDTEIVIQFLNEAPAFPDNNPIINGLTLEALGEGGGGPVIGDGDSDRDGVSDVAEALAGTDPNDAADYFRLTRVERTDTGASLSFQTVAGKTYGVEYSADLTAGSWVEIQGALVGDGAAVTVQDAEVRSQGFYRARVEP